MKNFEIMSTILPPPPMKPFAAIFAAQTAEIKEAIAAMSSHLNEEPDIVSSPFLVSETNYYAPEMGSELYKVYLTWPTLFHPEKLVDFKLSAMAYEDEKADGEGKRTVNIDPGYIFNGGLVLSTGKFRGHRLFIGRGLWAELTLNFHRGEFQAFPWTYLDYQQPDVQNYLIAMRRAYLTAAKEQLAF